MNNGGGGGGGGTPDMAMMPQPTPPDMAVATLEPGMFPSPLVELQRLVGVNYHLHTEEVSLRAGDYRIASCNQSGLDIADAKDPANMNYLANGIHPVIPNASPRALCNHAAWNGDILFTTLRGNANGPPYLAAWDTSKTQPGVPKPIPPPMQLALLQEPGIGYEGVQYDNGNIYVGLHEAGLGIYNFDPNAKMFTRVGLATGLTNVFNTFPRGKTVYVADGEGGLAVVDVTDPKNPKVQGEVATGGVARSVVVDGNNAYIGSGESGLVVVDVSNPAMPKVIASVPTPGLADQVAFAQNRVWVAAWNDARVFDVSTPSMPKIIGAVRFEEPAMYEQDAVGAVPGDIDTGRPYILSRTYAIAAHDDIAIVGNWHLLYSYRVHPDRVAPFIRFAETAADLIDFGQVAQGMSKTLPLDIYNDGTAPLTLNSIWAEDPQFTVSPKQVRIMPGTSSRLALTFTPTGRTAVGPEFHMYSDDPLQPVRTTLLAGNRPVLGVGSPMPDVKMTLTDGTEWDSSQVQKKVLVLAYFATF